ncbi:hypothetical protein [Micromonospora maritima]|uniref:hypothetical protein n=1 Tax=Micromonospora maritima TaxID=986711 RepID=UPI003787E32C
MADESSQSLAVYLQGRVKFFGELLQALPETRARADLLEKAKSLGLFWTSPDQIHRRITWFTASGFHTSGQRPMPRPLGRGIVDRLLEPETGLHDQ